MQISEINKLDETDGYLIHKDGDTLIISQRSKSGVDTVMMKGRIAFEFAQDVKNILNGDAA